MINARAIALQGLGFAAALVAVQGFAPVGAELPDLVTTPGYTAAADGRQLTAKGDDLRRAVLVAQVLRAESDQARAAEVQAVEYRASAARRAPAVGDDNRRTAFAEDIRRAASPGTTRKA